MPFKDPEKMKTYMRERRAKEKVAKQVNKNIVNPTRKPVNLNTSNNRDKKFSHITGSYDKGNWTAACPVCNFDNIMDPQRSFRPVDKCIHFQQLVSPGQPSEFLFNKVNKDTVNQTRKPVNRPKYLLSYSRNKYQYTLYLISPQGQKSLVQSFHKNSIFSLPCADIELTWGPAEVQ